MSDNVSNDSPKESLDEIIDDLLLDLGVEPEVDDTPDVDLDDLFG